MISDKKGIGGKAFFLKWVGGGVGQLLILADKGGGVLQIAILADIICEQPLIIN